MHDPWSTYRQLIAEQSGLARPHPPRDRVADALERIASALEASNVLARQVEKEDGGDAH